MQVPLLRPVQLRLVHSSPLVPPPFTEATAEARVFADALATARERGAATAALVSHQLPLVRLACLHGTARELAAQLDALFELREPGSARGELPALVERLADSLIRSGRRHAAARLREVMRRRMLFHARTYPRA